jgi:DNA repair protein RadA/Sms
MKLATTRGFDFGTNIKDIKVPDIFRKKVVSGIDYIDQAFGGNGMTPSQVTMFTGMAGAGKTTMMLTMCNGLAGNGSEVVFNTCEENLYQVKMHAERLGLRNGFKLGEESHVPTLLSKCDELRAKNPTKPFVLVLDSLQTMNDGYFANGATNGRTPERVLELVTNWCKDNNTLAIVIGQVGKGGQFLGSNVLKHMVDAMLTLTIDLKGTPERNPTYGLRILQMTKNRFGGGAVKQYLSIGKKGFTVAAVEGEVEDDE